MTYQEFEKIKYSFKGSPEIVESRANFDYIFGLDNKEFYSRFYKTNIIFLDFKYTERLPHYVRSIQPTGHLKEEILHFSSSLPRRTCGIHIRATDFYHTSQYKDNIQDLYMLYVHKLRELNIQSIFIASDTVKAVQWFKELKEFLVYTVDVTRSDSDKPLHSTDNNISSHFYESLLEMGILSKCSYIIRPKWSSFSAVSEYWSACLLKMFYI